MYSMPPLLETLPAPDFKEAVVMLPSPVTLSALEPCLVVLLRSWGTLLAPGEALALPLQSLGTRIAWHSSLACMLRSWGTLLAPEKALVLTLQSLGTRLIAWHPSLACMLPLSILPPALLDP